MRIQTRDQSSRVDSGRGGRRSRVVWSICRRVWRILRQILVLCSSGIHLGSSGERSGLDRKLAKNFSSLPA